MDSFFVSAPGKVILFGEHAVVHEKVPLSLSLHHPQHLYLHEIPEEETYLVGSGRNLSFPPVLSPRPIYTTQRRLHSTDSTQLP